MRRGIPFRLGVLLAAFGVLATGLTGLYSYTESRSLLVRAAERDLMSATQVFSRRLASVAGTIGDHARLLAELETTHAVVAGAAPAERARTALADVFAAMLRTHPDYLQVRLIGTTRHGRELVRVDREGEGTVRVPDSELGEKGDFPYVFEATGLRRGQLFLSTIAIDHEPDAHAALNRPTMHVSTPVPGPDGTAAALVVVSVDVHRVFGTLKADLPAHLQLFLANEWGDYLVHPDPAQTFAFERGRRVLIQDTFADVRPLLEGGRQPLLARGDVPGAPNDPVLGAFVKLPLERASDRRFVVLGIAEPLSEILASTRLLGRTTAQIVLAFSAIAIALAMAAARLVTRPLEQVTREVKRFSREQTMGALPTDRRDEIGELARGFAEMRERIASMLGELDASRNRMAHMARHDGLTGLPNRSVFIDRLEHGILAARRSGGALAVLFIDIDRFKQINDTHGHAVGDQVLVQSATVMRSTVREADTVSRWGGDEFVILLEGMDEEHEARRVAQALLDRFSRPLRVGTLELDLGVSIGISMYPRDAFDAAELIQRADEAMYLSKHRAGNRYSVFGNEIGSENVQ